MVSKTLALCAAALVQTVLAVPVAQEKKDFPVLRRSNTTVAPPKDPFTIVTEIPSLTQEELERLIREHMSDLDKRGVESEPRAVGEKLISRAQSTEGALLTFLDGEIQPGTNAQCEDFAWHGPFTSIHSWWGSSNVRGFSAASVSGNTSEIHASDSLSDGGEFKFVENERISNFTIGRQGSSPNVMAIKFSTDAGNSYSARSERLATAADSELTWESLNVGSGVLARIRGSSCSNLGIFGSIGFDFIDTIDSVGISDVDYEGFTNNIMPAGDGTEMTIGSQVLDNRNSSVQQTITLTTSDAITQQSVYTMDVWVSAGGTVGVTSKAGVPFIASGEVSTSVTWSIQNNHVSLSSSLLFFFFLFFSPQHSLSSTSTKKN